SAVTVVPTFPIPRSPSAVPCFSFGNQTDVYATPTANVEPHNPKANPQDRRLAKLEAKLAPNMNAPEISINAMNIGLPPIRSVSIPTGRRSTEPVRIGAPITHPTCARFNETTP